MVMLEMSMAKLQGYGPNTIPIARTVEVVPGVEMEEKGQEEKEDKKDLSCPEVRRTFEETLRKDRKPRKTSVTVEFPSVEESPTSTESSSPLILLPLFDFEKPKYPIKWSGAKDSKLVAKKPSSSPTSTGLMDLKDLRVHSQSLSSTATSSSSRSSSISSLVTSSSTSSCVTFQSSQTSCEKSDPALPLDGPSKKVPFISRSVNHDRLRSRTRTPQPPTTSTTSSFEPYQFTHSLLTLPEREEAAPDSPFHSPQLGTTTLPEVDIPVQVQLPMKESFQMRKLWGRVGVRTEKSIRGLRSSFALQA